MPWGCLRDECQLRLEPSLAQSTYLSAQLSLGNRIKAFTPE